MARRASSRATCASAHLEAAYRSRNTRDAYGRDVATLVAFVEREAPEAAADVRKIDLAVLRRWMADFSAARKTSSVARAVHAIRSWQRWLVRHGHLDDAPARDLGNPRVRRGLPRFLSAHAARELVEAPEQLAPAAGDRARWQRARDRAVSTRDVAAHAGAYVARSP